jgi:tetratricopeptide (TPR) repeat protein
MTVLTDSRGVPHLVERPPDIELVESAIVQLVSMKLDHERCRRSAWATPPVALQLMLAVDLLCSMERPAVLKAASICAAITETGPTEARTRAMLAAIGCWTAGDLVTARNGFQSLVDTYPGDVVSIFTAHMLDFYVGDAPHMLASIAKAVEIFPADDPVIGYLHGLHGFALEENGLIQAAIKPCRTALELNPDDVYAMHAMVHCLYETGRHEEGARYIREYMRGRDGSTPMRIHIWWHYALFELYADNVPEVLACYRIGIRRKTSLQSTEDLDAVTLLWRLALIRPSLDLSAYWQSLFQDWKPYLDESWYLFNDFHAYITYCHVGEYGCADSLLEAVTARGEGLPEEIVDIFLGFRSFTTGDYADAATRLARSFHRSFPMGGSNAQRDVIELTAIEAAIRSRNHEAAQRIRDSGRFLRHQSPVVQHYKDRLAALTASELSASENTAQEVLT